MRKDKIAQVTIRDLHRMTKAEARRLIAWLNAKALDLDQAVDGPWLVTRKQFARLFNMSLMK